MTQPPALQYKSVVTFEEEQSESVQNGRTLGKSVDFLSVRTTRSIFDNGAGFPLAQAATIFLGTFSGFAYTDAHALCIYSPAAGCFAYGLRTIGAACHGADYNDGGHARA